MTHKFVTPDAIKYLKEVGYPLIRCQTVSKEQFEAGWGYKYSTDPGFYSESPSILYPYDNDAIDMYYSPTYIEVWLWLWQQKKIYIDINCIQCSEYNTEVSIWHEYGQYDYEGKFTDPVEAMIGGINYLVSNKLIK